MEDDILTIEEVARYLRVSERTVYDWAQKGEIPSGKIGTVWRFKKAEIEKWVNDRLSSSSKPTLQNNQIQVKSILSPDRIIFLNHSTKHDALLALADNLSTAPQVKATYTFYNTKLAKAMDTKDKKNKFLAAIMDKNNLLMANKMKLKEKEELTQLLTDSKNLKKGI